MATVQTKQQLQGQLSRLGQDPRLLQLPRPASLELKELVVNAVKDHTSATEVWAAILGGISENSSTGLRKWASTQGRGNEAALALESILATTGAAAAVSACSARAVSRAASGLRWLPLASLVGGVALPRPAPRPRWQGTTRPAPRPA